VKKKFSGGAISLAFILIVAFAMRATMAWDYARVRPKQALAILPFHFESGNIAISLARGKGFGSPFLVPTGPTAWMTPVYPFLLAGILRFWGIYTFQSYIAAVGLNILFSTLACVPIFYVGKRIGGVGLGLLAASLWAIFPNANLLTFESLWDASVDSFLGAAILWATLALEANPRPRMRHWVGYGLLWGLALMTNATFESLVPFLLGWIAYRHWKKGFEPWARQAAVSVFVIVLCCVPWTVRNYQVFHAWVPLRSVFGLQTWLGNNSQTTPVWLGLLHPIFNSAEREKYIEMGEIAYMREKRNLAIEFVEENPRRVLELSVLRFITVWSGGTAYPVRDFFNNHDLWFRYVLLFNIVAAFGTLTGILLLWRGHSEYTFPLAATILIYPVPYYLTLVEPRYRLPIDPLVMMLLAVTLQALLGHGESAESRKLETKSAAVPEKGVH
jgi:4-amino-4-deoxy-L-arabinose transferase-like glycosyltransferase